MNKHFGVIREKIKRSDWRMSIETIVNRAPKGTQSFEKNGSIQYDQAEAGPSSCTVHGAIGAYSDLSGIKLSLAHRKAIWQEACNRGAGPNGWYINEAVDLVRQYCNENFPFKVSSYRIMIGSYEHGVVTRLGYSVITGYKGSQGYKDDRKDNLVIDDVGIPQDPFYAHCLRTNYSVFDEYDRLVDNYAGRVTNIYHIPTAKWKKAKDNGLFYRYGYVYLSK